MHVYITVCEALHAYVNMSVCVCVCKGLVGQNDTHLFLVFETGCAIDLELTDECNNARDPPAQC